MALQLATCEENNRQFTVASLDGSTASNPFTNTIKVTHVIRFFKDKFGGVEYLLYIRGKENPLPPNYFIKDITTETHVCFHIIPLCNPMTLLSQYTFYKQELKESAELNESHEVNSSAELNESHEVNNSSGLNEMSLLEYVKVYLNTKESSMFSYIFSVDIFIGLYDNEMYLLYTRCPVNGYHWRVITKYKYHREPYIRCLTEKDVSDLDLKSAIKCISSSKNHLNIRYNNELNQIEYYDASTNENENIYVYETKRTCARCIPGTWEDCYCENCHYANSMKKYYSKRKIGFM